MSVRLNLALSLSCLLAICLGGCQQQAPAPAKATAQPSKQPPKKLAVKFLPNSWRIHEKVISGGQPAGEAAFKELADLGVKTVISVDGATPDVATAKKYGLRYVHLPHGYDGVPEQRAKELAKAVRDLPGPIYIHCHHGKHRSPSASAVACVSAGLLDPSLAETVLKSAGTIEGYRGLYASAREAQKLDDKLLDELNADFPETAKIPPLAEAMVALEHTHDHLKSIAAAGWKSPPDHPDLAPAHEALLLREHFTELMRTDAATVIPTRSVSEGAKFMEMLQASETAAQQLENALTAPASEESQPQAAAAFELVNKNCSACHKAFRDVPLSEKGQHHEQGT
jgi:protein tyrosine phosphatase (PTP) superfamily phosphohydrolase (DUF442 family)